MRSARQTARTIDVRACFASLRSEQGVAPLAASPIPAYLSYGNGFDKLFPNDKSENRTHYIDRLPIIGRRSFCIQKPRHCGGVKKSLSGEQRKEAPSVLIY